MPINIDYIKFWLKASNSKGHGMHSPFVYDFIINVLNDDRTFYCFKELEEQRKKVINQSNINLLKVDKLLFKMIDYYNSENILSICSNPATVNYLAKANTKNTVTNCIDVNDIKQQKNDFIYIDINNNIVNELNIILETCLSKSLIVVNKNHSNAMQQNLWQNLIEDDRINTTIDLYNLGIAVINNDIKTKQHFNIRY